MRNVFKIKGLDCASCALKLEDKIKKVMGVENATISFMTEKLVIECSEEEKEVVIKNIKKVIKKEEPDVVIEEA